MVNRRSTSTTPEPILQLQRQLEDFRSSQSGRVKLPDSLWQAAVELARQYGIWPVAHPFTTGLYAFEETPGQGPATASPQSRSPVFHRSGGGATGSAGGVCY